MLSLKQYFPIVFLFSKWHQLHCSSVGSLQYTSCRLYVWTMFVNLLRRHESHSLRLLGKFRQTSVRVKDVNFAPCKSRNYFFHICQPDTLFTNSCSFSKNISRCFILVCETGWRTAIFPCRFTSWGISLSSV